MNQIETVAAPRATTESPSVLVVDDEQDARDIVAFAVRALGHSCKVARDGLEALEMYETGRADVVISDLKMPGMDGLELCRRIRAGDPTHAYTHFIFATGNEEQSLVGMLAGADDYLVKPIDMEALEACLRFAIRALAAHREARAEESLAGAIPKH
jgi:DNA-binding response OmpR family regulator